MELEAGKFYRTRNGKKAYCIGKSKFSIDSPWVVEIFEEGRPYYYYELEDSYFTSCEDVGSLDMVSEWEEDPDRILPIEGRLITEELIRAICKVVLDETLKLKEA